MNVSIIIPVYNVSLYIERCIKSVMNQTYQDIECILVNDASPDNSITIAERLIADYDGSIQFRILNHEHNKGQSAARNTGIKAASGDYIYFLDSDDEITPDCIEKLSHPILNDPTIEMVEGCFAKIFRDSLNNPIEQPFLPRPQLEYSSKKAVRDFFFSRQYENKLPCNKLVKRDFILQNKLYFKEGVRWEDFLWHFHYNKYLSHLYIIPDITYKYHIRPNSTTTGTSKETINHYFSLIYEDIAKNLSPDDSAREVKYFLKGFYLFILDSPTIPLYKETSCQFLKVLKDNHCVKEWLCLKTVIFISKFALTRKLIGNAGELLRKHIKRK